MIDGRITALDALRYTPAGIAIVQAKLQHESSQTEAGGERRVELEIGCVALERNAQLLAVAPLGTPLRAEGFVASRSRSSRRLVLHITHLEFLQGAEHGNG